MDRFWLCWIEGTDGGFHYQHRNREQAFGEAERLARIPGNQGKIGYVLECIAQCKVELVPIKWEIPSSNHEAID